MQYIDLLELGPFTSANGLNVIPCSPYVPPEGQYAYCLQANNDGAGNRFIIGIVEFSQVTLTLTSYLETLSNAVPDDTSPYRAFSTVLLKVTTSPLTPGLTIQYRVASNSVPQTEDGSFLSRSNSVTNIADDLGDGTYQLRYVAKMETADDKCENDSELQRQNITVEAALAAGSAHAEIQLTVLSRFNFMMGLGPLDHKAVIEYVRDKYAIVFPYWSFQSYDAGMSKKTRGNTTPYDQVTVGSAAFSSENLLASTLFHESVHVRELYPDQMRYAIGKGLYDKHRAAVEAEENGGAAARPLPRLLKGYVREWARAELLAYVTEVTNAGLTCLNTTELQGIKLLVEEFTDIEFEFR